MHNEDQSKEKDDPAKLKRKPEEVPHVSRRKLLRQKIHRTIPESEKFHQDDIMETGHMVLLVNPQSSKIPSSHNALEQANQSEVPEAAYYPSAQGQYFMMGMPLGEGLQGAPEFIPLGSPQLPPLDCPEEDLERHQYQEIMQMLVQAIHNQNRIMEECRNILTSIHHAITPMPTPLQPQPAPPQPSPQPQRPPQEQQQPPPPPPPPAFSSSVATIVSHNTQPAQLMPLWNPLNDSQLHEEVQAATILHQVQHKQQKTAESQSKQMQNPPIPKAHHSSTVTKKTSVKSEPKETQQQQPTLIPTVPPPQPPPINLQTVSSSKEPDKPTVYGPDGEFSSAYLRYVYSKSSTATSFANVLMKEVFNLEERISSNCNGVMGKKALEPERLDKIKRAVKRFYTDTEEEFQDLWKKCRKSIDSTNRNLKFVIMKKPNL